VDAVNKRTILVSAVTAAAVLAAAIAFKLLHKGGGNASQEAYASAGAPGGSTQVVKLDVPDSPGVPAAWVEVYEPAKVWSVLRENAWIKQALAEPLGEGFLGSWTAFLGSRGEDLKASFKGEVATFAAEKLLGDPFRLVWYGGQTVSGAPAAVVPNPGHASRAAFAALTEAVGRGGLQAERCPVTPDEGKAGDDKKDSKGKERQDGKPIVIQRWLVAEHAVYAGSSDDRIVISRQPLAVLHGLCALPPPATRPQGTDLELVLSKDGFGVDAAALGELVGLGPALRLGFSVEQAALVPRGIAGELAKPGRLATAAPPEKLLSSIPEQTGVIMTLALQLPADLSNESLEGVFKGAAPGAGATRQVALIWNPRAGENAMELALLWASPAAQARSDKQALEGIFSGPHQLQRREVCGYQALGSTTGLLDRMARACAGKEPSVLNGAPSVKAGLLAPASVGLGVNVGKVLSGLATDAFRAERTEARTPPPEIESARRLLEALPFMGLRGVAQEKALVPGGYKS
jgi:hypothetical protein